MTNPRRPLRLNVGFLIKSPIGTSRDFNFDFEKMRLGADVSLSKFLGTARFDRTPQGLFLQADFSGGLELECVRCLETFDQQIHSSLEDLYAFDKRYVTDSNLLVPEDGQIDLAPLFREVALLEVPINPICKPDCKGLCPICGENLNKVGCGHASPGSESPFAVLKDLLK
ncbi:MAG TPA: DUF177 domain-containing protein [Aggregatilineaceae bacterium]|nr:DUF177 domain-containing protein [Aggregatilineaceae bacterium]